MKLTFPQLGDAHLLGRLFFREIGVELISPPPNTSEGLARGSALSPEEMCLPFKLMMHNLESAWQQGADTVLMPASMGPCRLGEYAELLKTLLEEEGMTYRWILLDSPRAIGWNELLRRIRLLTDPGGKRFAFLLDRLVRLYRLNRLLEGFLAEAAIGCGWEGETSQGRIKSLTAMCRRELLQADSLSQGMELVKRHRTILKEEIRRQKRAWAERSQWDRPLRILLTGEIYSGIEPFANHRIEELLMELGVSFQKPVTMGWWLGRSLKNPLRLGKLLRKGNILEKIDEKHLKKTGASKRKTGKMPYEIGGYARDTVEESLRSMDRGLDGVIQILPAGCMPEIVAKSVLSGISRDQGLKCLTLVFDEGAGDAGYVTRVEAFVDLLWRIRQQKAKFERNHFVPTRQTQRLKAVVPTQTIQPTQTILSTQTVPTTQAIQLTRETPPTQTILSTQAIPLAQAIQSAQSTRAVSEAEALSASAATKKRRGKHVLFGN